MSSSSDPERPRESPRYPQVRVGLRSSNPLVLVAAVRQGLRNAGVEAETIGTFTTEALAGDETELRDTCAAWVDTAESEIELD